MLGQANTYDLTTVGSQWRSFPKIVMIDRMKILPAPVIIQENSHQYPEIFFIKETAMIHPVIFSGKRYPGIIIQPFGIIEIIDHTICKTAVVSHMIFVQPEIDHRLITCITIFKKQPGYDQVLATDL